MMRICRQLSTCCGVVSLRGLVIALVLAPPTIVLAAGQSPSRLPRISFDSAHIDPAVGNRIEQAVSTALENGEMAGCVVLVGRRAGIVFEQAYGNRRVEPDVAPMTTDTVFDMASITKPVATATSIMILVERGQLRLSDKVADYFPDFAAHDKQDITVEQLLTHTSGLIPDNPLDDYKNGWESAGPLIFDLKPESPPGEKFKYSDVNFILLGKIVEKVSGKPVNEFARDEIYSKLGMTETGYLPPTALRDRAASTEKNGDDWLQGKVHDPRAAKMGGVAGHAGLFSTADDLAVYAQMMLQQGEFNGARVMSPVTVAEMTRARDSGQQRRALGWDARSRYSRNRSELMSPLAFGHGGFTGTAMWIDPGLDLYVIFLSNRLHPDGKGEVNSLAGRIGTLVCGALLESAPNFSQGPRESVRLGIDVLAANGFKELDGRRVGLITNHTGVDSSGVSTVELLHKAPNVKLVALFSPEHGLSGKFDQPDVASSVDEKTGLPIHSLYHGKDRKPSQEHLAAVDTLVFDIQDIGCRFYTYPSTMGLAMEEAARAGKRFVVLDRPNPIAGDVVEGPLRDEALSSFVAFYNVPVRHGMTLGELAKMYAAEKKLELDLVVVAVEGWRRSDYWFDTGTTWVDQSPNMRSLRAAVLYPGIGLLETTNVSVGRGTDTPFEVMGAPWIRERELATAINAASPPGVRVVPIRFTPTASKFKGESCGGVSFVITDWAKFRSLDLGLVVAHALRSLYPDDWKTKDYIKLLANKDVFDDIVRGDDAESIRRSYESDISKFLKRRKPFELY